MVDKEFVLGAAVGLGAVMLVPGMAKTFVRVTRPLARAAIKGGLVAYRELREAGAEAYEHFEDVVAEAREEALNLETEAREGEDLSVQDLGKAAKGAATAAQNVAEEVAEAIREVQAAKVNGA